jgi:hypothetical protein
MGGEEGPTGPTGPTGPSVPINLPGDNMLGLKNHLETIREIFLIWENSKCSMRVV